MNTSTPVLPVVANGFSGHHGHGLEGKDAVLIHSNQTALNSHLLNESVSRNSKEDVVKTLESSCRAERESIENRIQAERLERENQKVIISENQRTRDLIMSMEAQRNSEAKADGQFAVLKALIDSLKK